MYSNYRHVNIPDNKIMLQVYCYLLTHDQFPNIFTWLSCWTNGRFIYKSFEKIWIRIKNLDPLRAKEIFIWQKMGHTYFLH